MVTHMILCILGILACGLILVKAIKNYKILNNKYIELQTSICLSYCQEYFFKTDSIFIMEN